MNYFVKYIARVLEVPEFVAKNYAKHVNCTNFPIMKDWLFKDLLWWIGCEVANGEKIYKCKC